MKTRKYFEGKQRAATEEYLKQIEDNTDEIDHITILNKKFVVFRKVFSPKYFKDPEFFIDAIPIKKGDSFLEIGCGSGIISIFCIYKGASNVVSIDINPLAVENTKSNADLHGIKNIIQVLQGDVFEPLDSERFDTIFWNTPWGS